MSESEPQGHVPEHPEKILHDAEAILTAASNETGYTTAQARLRALIALMSPTHPIYPEEREHIAHLFEQLLDQLELKRSS